MPQLKRDAKEIILIIDGDNTIWDTNASFEEAQRNMLRKLRIAPRTGFKKLRELDDMLVKRFHKYEYDFSALALSLFLYSKGLGKNEAVRNAYESFANRFDIEGKDLSIKCGKEFKEEIRSAIPPLFKGAKKTLKTLKKLGCALILSSEGHEERIRSILKHYSLNKYFDHIMNGRKNVKQFKEARRLGVKIWRQKHPKHIATPRVIVVGDLLNRDILLGNAIGAVTVYKPGGYKGVQVPKDKGEVPTYKIKEMYEIVDLAKAWLV